LNHTNADKKRGYGCYLSVWRKQPDGTWRVFIDVGADAPEPVGFAPGFNRIAFGSRYAGKDGKAASTASLAAADRDLNSEVASLGPGRAFETRLSPASRLHRPGTLPIAGRDAVTAWMRSHATAGSATHSAAEASIAGDFGYTYGRFETSGPQPSAGVYIRLWSRDASGRWWLMVDVAQPFKPRP
jgi:ketosteroid isomerase-like protein